MKRISQTFCIILLLGFVGITNAEATWRVGGSLGLGQYKASSFEGLEDSKSGSLIALGSSLTFPFGFYTRYDAMAFSSGVMTGEITILSFGWRHEIFDLYHIAWGWGRGTARLRDDDFKYDDEFDKQTADQTFISVGYRLWPLVDIALGVQRVNTSKKYTDERSIGGTIVSANLIYNFE